VTPAAAQVRARFAVKHGQPVPPEVVGILLAELDARGVAIERVRELCEPEQDVELRQLIDELRRELAKERDVNRYNAHEWRAYRAQRDELLAAVKPVLNGEGVLGDVLRNLRGVIERIEADR
jgi:vacuolar-type H+-ATPase subunit I/STV1